MTAGTPGMVSVIMPVYNGAEFLSRSVESVQRQTFGGWELLLVDDGSIDGSAQLCDRYAASDPRIRVIHCPHGGPSRARNAGLDHAQGEWLFFLDSDDWLPDDSLETLLRYTPDADVVLGNYPEKGPTMRSVDAPRRFVFDSITRQELTELVFLRMFHPVWNKLFRRERIIGRFREDMSYGEDAAFNLAQLPGWRTAVVIPDMTYHYSTRHGSITNSYHTNRMEQVQLSFDMFYGSFHDCPEVMALQSCWYVDELRLFFVYYATPDMPQAMRELMILTWLTDPEFKPDRICAGALTPSLARFWRLVLQQDVQGILRLLTPKST